MYEDAVRLPDALYQHSDPAQGNDLGRFLKGPDDLERQT